METWKVTISYFRRGQCAVVRPWYREHGNQCFKLATWFEDSFCCPYLLVYRVTKKKKCPTVTLAFSMEKLDKSIYTHLREEKLLGS